MSGATQLFSDHVKKWISQHSSRAPLPSTKTGGNAAAQSLRTRVKASQPNAKTKKVLEANKITGRTAKANKKDKKRPDDITSSKPAKRARHDHEDGAVGTASSAGDGCQQLPLSSALQHLELLWHGLHKQCKDYFERLQREQLAAETEAKALAQQRTELKEKSEQLDQQRQAFEEEQKEFERQKEQLKKDKGESQDAESRSRDTRMAWMFEEAGEWKHYSPDHSLQLTAAQRAGQSQVLLQRSHFTYDIDFSSMRQTNKQTGKQRSILCKTVTLPMASEMLRGPLQTCRHLAALPTSGCRITLTPGSLAKGSLEEALYCRAEAQFHRMMKSATSSPVRIDVVVNECVAQRYEDARAAFVASGRPVEEEYAFHGTGEPNIHKIVSQGFKVGGVDVPMTNGASYGPGVYLAKHPELSMKLTRGARSLLVVRFLTCEALAHREAWVLPNPAHVYPEFVVHYP